MDLIDRVISNDLFQIPNFPTRTPDYDAHSPVILVLFLLPGFQLVYCWHSSYISLVPTINLVCQRLSSDKLVIITKEYLNVTNVLMIIRQGRLSFFRSLALVTFDRLLIEFPRKTNVISPQFNRPELLSSASDKTNMFAETFSDKSNLDDSGISLPVFPCGTNGILHNSPVLSIV